MTTKIRFWMVLAMLALAAVGFHGLRHGEDIPSRAALSSLRMQHGSWQAFDVPLDKAIVKAAGVDEYVSRSYIQSDRPPVSLYVGYYRSQRTGDTIHSPKNCLPGAGWQPVSSKTITLRDPRGRDVSVNLYLIQNDTDRQIVLYWYQSHGRVVASEYAAKIYLVLDAIRLNRTDGALVRITTPVQQDPDESQKRAVAFAEELMPALNDVLPR